MSNSHRFFCIHGHFYQPARGNPWTGVIDSQESAKPFHDWNERVSAQCYQPNAELKNFAKISFNFGPTLLTWLEIHAPTVYAEIINADQSSCLKRHGHGNALAQVYNHVIMPLQSYRDKVTEVCWGVADFKHRFGRLPEGMWLPETALDLESLDVLASRGIKFTIAAPHQACRARALPNGPWRDFAPGTIDPTRTYRCFLPSGRFIDIFFYNARLAHDVAFGQLLASSHDFVQKISESFVPDGDEGALNQQLLNFATDGESYGHHFPGGAKVLASALERIEQEQLVQLTNYGEFLELVQPQQEVEIIPNTSWSCAHGIDRWRRDCGCRVNKDCNISQAWRLSLREACDWLKEKLDRLYEERGQRLLRDPWEARNDYIDILLESSPPVINNFFSTHALKDLKPPERKIVLDLLEMQKFGLFMFTSCGWFFDDIAGLEAQQNIRYANRAAEIAGQFCDDNLMARFEKIVSDNNQVI